MKHNNNLDFTNAIQNGINEFGRLSGYKIDETLSKSTATTQRKKAKKMRWRIISFLKMIIS